MYKINVELNEGCVQVFYFDVSKLEKGASLLKLAHEWKSDLGGSKVRIEKVG